MEPGINSDLTGPFSTLWGLGLFAFNTGTGNITYAAGGAFAMNDGGASGTTTTLVGGQFSAILQNFSGSTRNVTNIYHGLFGVPSQRVFRGNQVVGTFADIYCAAPLPLDVFGGTITNAFGIYIEDMSGIGDTASYNILSKHTSFITPSSTVGGNLFQGHTAIGNYADVDNLTGSPGDSTNTYIQPATAVLGVNEFFHNPTNQELVGVPIYTGAKLTTGASNWIVDGIDCEPAINSDSTDAISQYYAFFSNPYNYGSGNIADFVANYCIAQHFGSGTVTALGGFRAVAQALGGNVTTLFGAESALRVDLGTVGNAYGLWVKSSYPQRRHHHQQLRPIRC